MPFSVNAFNHAEWERHGLKDYGDFSEQVSEVNVRDFAEGSTGDWFFADDEVLPAMKGVDYKGQTPNEKAIYFGSWGNDNSPGADMYTNAEIFDMDDPEEAAEHARRIAEWEAAPEFIESDDEDEYEDDEQEICEDDDETPTEPDEGDWVTQDYKTWSCFGQPNSTITLNPDNWGDELHLQMYNDSFFPNAWYQGERGDWNLLNIVLMKYMDECTEDELKIKFPSKEELEKRLKK